MTPTQKTIEKLTLLNTKCFVTLMSIGRRNPNRNKLLARQQYVSNQLRMARALLEKTNA